MIAIKLCSKCRELKDESEFNKNRTAKDGLQRWCKTCSSAHYRANRESVYARQRQFYKENPETLKDITKRYYYSHLDKCHARWARYYAKSSEHLNARNKEWRDANPDKERDRHRRYRDENADKVELYRIENAERIKERSRRWYKRNKARLKQVRRDWYQRNKPTLRHIRRVYMYERDRQLGYVPLNSVFDGSNFHHLIVLKSGKLDYDVGIYIPRDLHRSVPHNRKSLLNIDAINDLAISWVLGEGYRRAAALNKLAGGDSGKPLGD